jgi:Protein of unknown function (DUF1353)
MTSKKEFLKQWMQSEGPKKMAPTARRSATGSSGAHPETADANTQAELAPPPALVPFADMDVWYLTNDMTWTIPGSATVLRVPRGFATDFASVPSWFWSWMPPIGRYGLPAIVHDWLYWDQQLTRDQADGVFKTALDELKVSPWRRFVLYRSVRWFGQRYWQDNTIAKTAGDGRVLKLYPNDARITWADWRKRPGVFV